MKGEDTLGLSLGDDDGITVGIEKGRAVGDAVGSTDGDALGISTMSVERTACEVKDAALIDAIVTDELPSTATASAAIMSKSPSPVEYNVDDTYVYQYSGILYIL